MTDRVLAIDGGNSKTAVLLVDADGQVLAQVRGPGASPQNVGLERSLEIFDGLVRDVARQAGLSPDERIARHTAAYLAGADLPREERELQAEIERHGWSDTSVVGNDTFALLRAGTTDGIGVAVVCGAGINCVAVAKDGRTHRFPALGRISGDWGGGGHIGSEALWLAVRAEDGRGTPTALLDAVIAHFGTTTIAEAVERIHFGEADADEHALCQVLFDVAASGDQVALDVVARLVEEVTVLTEVSLRRLDLLEERVDVVLGGGVLTGTGDIVVGAVRDRLSAVAPHARIRVVDLPPVVGAALLGLDTIGTSPAAELRLRSAYTDLPSEPALGVAAGG